MLSTTDTIERDFLGVLVKWPDEIADARDQVQPSDLHHDAHQKVYAAILAMYDRKERIDAAGLMNHLRLAGQFDDVGVELFADLAGYSGTAMHMAKNIERLLSLSLGRGLRYALAEAMGEIENPTGPPEELLDRTMAKLDKLTARCVGSTATPVSVIMSNLLTEIDLRRAGKARTGVPTGFHALDEIFCGGIPNGLTILAARPSVGKTAFALHLSRNICSDGGGVLFVSLEQPEMEVGERLAAGASGVPGSAIHSGRVDYHQAQRITDAADKVNRWRMWAIDNPVQTAGQISAGARRMRRKAGRLDLIVVDYLNLIRPENPKATRNEQVGASATRLREMARELQVPVLLLCQLNRGAADGDGVPKLHQLRDSGEIEQVADAVVFLHRAAPWQPNTPDKIELHVAKHRNGPLGMVTFDHDSKVYTFAEGTPIL